MSAGLTSQQALERLVKYGRNAVDQSKPPSTLALIFRSLFEPFNGLMLVVAILTAVPPNSSYSTFALIMVILPPLCGSSWIVPSVHPPVAASPATMHSVHLINALPAGIAEQLVT